jgi:hypothetical protein
MAGASVAGASVAGAVVGAGASVAGVPHAASAREAITSRLNKASKLFFILLSLAEFRISKQWLNCSDSLFYNITSFRHLLDL